MFAMKDETMPRAFLNYAREYCEAANILLDAYTTKNRELFNPIYMLYFHATELALKAFLRQKGFKTEDLKRQQLRHNLSALHDKCVEEEPGFDALVSSNELNLRNITELLDSGNKDYAFRYWTPNSRSIARIDWVKKTVNELIKYMDKCIPMNKTPGKAGSPLLILSEPQPKKSV